MKISSELLKGTTKVVVLSILQGEALYGYQIIKQIRERSEDVLQFGEGSMYPVLHSLERDKFVTSAWVNQKIGPSRKYYKLTAKGKTYLEEAKGEWRTYALAVQRVLSIAL